MIVLKKYSLADLDTSIENDKEKKLVKVYLPLKPMDTGSYFTT